MIRIFNHYLHRRTLLQVMIDLGLIVALVLALSLGPLGDAGQGIALPLLAALVLAACVFVINSATGFYEYAHNRTLLQSLARATAGIVVGLPLAWLIFGLLPAAVPGRELMQLAAMGGVAAVFGQRVFFSHSKAQSLIRTRILIYGAGPAAQLVAQTLTQSDPHAEIVGFVVGPNETEIAVSSHEILKSDRPLSDLARDLRVDEIVVALSERRGGSMPLRQLLDCKLSGVRVLDISAHFEKSLAQIRIDHVHAGALIFGEGFNQGWLRTVVKRVFDVVCALVLLSLALPVMVVTAIAIKLESRGPVFYRQVRVGYNGKPFEVIKFRSMRSDAEGDGKPRWAKANDDRVTRVGRLIRKLRIDELPQLINVLRGEMSLVGPRPERPYFVEQLTQQVPFYAVRHSMKPGVTGWAQVRYHYGESVEDAKRKLEYDLYYVKNHSLFLDLVIILETIAVVLTARGSR
ncbi:TIGR03013 family XrtA/PEP-CTERM system glycosyltransferase [Azohydromonas sediminis]|uniref:TIGR03013 family XrtA/PEP-CTERM system glycosyltransferase n=1 Tax=Azohydromonas sediminis TaxID=2259674 RepID=UPI000E652BB3|nr:TIGR03013 family XrtA/PEP-CTERM system glycosyltransferase [Azohydromonas sediminis]